MKILSFVLILSLLSNESCFGTVQARHLHMTNFTTTRNFLGGLSFGAIKNFGSSCSGDGHNFTDVVTLGGIKNSGPSPSGNCHNFNDVVTLDCIKSSAPSPGISHNLDIDQHH
ncbi:hypothetical protein SDJN03_30117, partial [Cucurbita argyrosperma subsp. sororia]